MPEIRLKFPVVLRSREDDLTLAVALGIPECSVADGTAESAISGLQKQLVTFCEKLLPDDLLSRLVRGQAQLDWITVKLKSPNRSLAWREEIACPVAVVRHQLESGLHAAYIPGLRLTSITDNAAHLEDLIRRQVIAALRRENKLTLHGIANLSVDQISIQHVEFDLKLKSPKDLLAAQRLTTSGAVQSLKKYAVQLHPQKVSSIEHREETVRQLAECLREPFACSVLLVGPPGVGKTAIFKELARRHNELGFAGKTFWMTEGSAVVAGATGFGMWQERCGQLIEGVRHRDGILHVGNLFELTEAGRINGSEGVAALMSGPMRSGRLVAIAECTEQQYTMLERQEPGVTSCFERIVIEPTNEEQTRDILLKESITLEARTSVAKNGEGEIGGSVTVDPAALQLLDRLHRRFTTDVASPGRPLQWLRQWSDELHQGNSASCTLDTEVVTQRFSSTSGLPRFLIDPNTRPDLSAIKQRLQAEVIGQEEVIETLVGFIATLAADLQRPFRPLASLLLIGPTGVGKTETAKALARLIYNDATRLSRIDMSEFCTPGSAERLVGGVGCDGDGALTGAVRRQPFSVLLLDEIEKAHHSVFDILLQVLGEARLTDHKGRTASFANCIVLMTSNLGADTFRAQSMGLATDSPEDSYANHFDRSVRSFFRPEFYNRIDRILAYRPLPMDIVQRIADRRIQAVAQRAGLRERGVELQLADDVVSWISRQGYQPEYGARPLVRAIERELVIPISEQLLGMRGKTASLNVELQKNVSQQATQEPGKIKINSIVSQTNTMVESGRKEAELCQLASKLRRMGQAMKRTSGYRDAEYKLTQLTRQIDRMQEQPSRSYYHQQALDQHLAEQKHYQQRMQEWNRLVTDLEASESQALLAFYHRQPIDVENQFVALEKYRSRLWLILLDMLQGSLRQSKSTHLFILGTQPLAALPLVNAYVAQADAWGAIVKVKLLRSAKNAPSDTWLGRFGERPYIRFYERESSSIWPGRNERVLSNEEDTLTVFDHELESKMNSGKLAPAMEAWSCEREPKPNSVPVDALGFMVTTFGASICSYLRSEVGMHTFRPAESPDGKRDITLLVEVHQGDADHYEVPRKLADRKMELTADLRRFYNAAEQQIKDVSLNAVYPFGSSLENAIRELIEKQLEISVWEQLE